MVAELPIESADMASAQQVNAMAAQIENLNERLQVSDQQIQALMRSAEEDKAQIMMLKTVADEAKKTAEMANTAKEHSGYGRGDLMDFKNTKYPIFGTKATDAFRPWAKSFKASCNGLRNGFRKALESVEKFTEPIGEVQIRSLGWAPALDLN